MEKQRETPRYSFVYNALVENEGDFVGLVAYSIYKKEKISYVRRFEEKNKRPPTPEELQDFHAQAHDRIEQYKQVAVVRVAQFYSDIYKTRCDDLEVEYRQKFIDEVKKFGPNWFIGICQSVIGSFLYSLLIGIIVVLLLYSKFGFEWVVRQTIDSQPEIGMPEKTAK